MGSPTYCVLNHALAISSCRYCEESSTKQSQSASYRSIHSLLKSLINSTFFALEPPLICFSLSIAPQHL